MLILGYSSPIQEQIQSFFLFHKQQMQLFGMT